MSTYLCLIIGYLSLAWLLILSTTCSETSPNRAPAAPEQLTLIGRNNFRYPLLSFPYPNQTSPPLTERSAGSYSKQSCPHTFTCRRG